MSRTVRVTRRLEDGYDLAPGYEHGVAPYYSGFHPGYVQYSHTPAYAPPSPTAAQYTYHVHEPPVVQRAWEERRPEVSSAPRAPLLMAAPSTGVASSQRDIALAERESAIARREAALAGREAATAAREAQLASREAASVHQQAAMAASVRAASPAPALPAPALPAPALPAPVAKAGDATPSKEEKKAAIEAKVKELITAAKKRAVPKTASRPKTVVLTGGPGVGKTTLLDHIKEKLGGCTVIPEAAIQALGKLNEVMGKDGQKAWRYKNTFAFGDMVGRVAMAQEAQAAQKARDGASALILFDRTVLDNFGYSLERGYDLPDYLDADAVAAALARIDYVMVLDEVASIEEIQKRNEETGRKTDPKATESMSKKLEFVYKELGCRVERLAKGTVEERAAALFAKCEIAPPV